MPLHHQHFSSSRLISIAERLLTIRLQHDLVASDIDLTVEQWRIMYYLWIEDGINQQELAERVVKEKSTITRLISALEKKGLITRQHLHNDKRNKQIFVTPQGQVLKDEALTKGRKITQEAEEGISGEEIETFKKVVSKITANLSATSPIKTNTIS